MKKNEPTSNEFPLIKNDHLGRRIYVDWNGAERSIYQYWDDTKVIKIKYRLYHKDVSFDAYDKTGKNIISYSSGVFDLKLPKFWTDDFGEIFFYTERSKTINWRKIATKHTTK